MSHAATILMFDSDTHRRDGLTRYLRAQGFRALVALSERDFWRRLDQPDIQILIVGAPAAGVNSIECLSRIRIESSLPLLLAGSSTDPTDRIMALELGADDYLPPCAGEREWLARIRALLRRCMLVERARQSEPLHFAGWRFDPQSARLWAPDQRRVHLTAAERRLLQVFLAAPRRILSRERLLRQCADPSHEAGDRSIDTLVCRLRGKLDPGMIRTERSAGYVFTAAVMRTAEEVEGPAWRPSPTQSMAV